MYFGLCTLKCISFSKSLRESASFESMAGSRNLLHTMHEAYNPVDPNRARVEPTDLAPASTDPQQKHSKGQLDTKSRREGAAARQAGPPTKNSCSFSNMGSAIKIALCSCLTLLPGSIWVLLSQVLHTSFPSPVPCAANPDFLGKQKFGKAQVKPDVLPHS